MDGEASGSIESGKAETGRAILGSYVKSCCTKSKLLAAEMGFWQVTHTVLAKKSPTKAYLLPFS